MTLTVYLVPFLAHASAVVHSLLPTTDNDDVAAKQVRATDASFLSSESVRRRPKADLDAISGLRVQFYLYDPHLFSAFTDCKQSFGNTKHQLTRMVIEERNLSV